MAEVTANDLMRSDFVRVDKEDSVNTLISKVMKSGYNSALIFDGNKFLGIATPRSLLRKRIDFAKVKAKTVAESCPVITKDTGLVKIAGLMLSSGYRLLPVSENGRVTGVVPSQKVIEQAGLMPETKSLSAEAVATPKVVVLRNDTSIEEAFSLMRDNRLKKVIVFDAKGKVSGILSMDDILEKYLLRGNK